MQGTHRAAAKPDHELNRRTYNSPDVVLSFALRRALQAPEARICTVLAPRLHQMNMLDIGVGGGRTTHHFIERVREYVAIDYCPRMVWACQRKFPNQRDSFVVGDARSMPEFSDQRFDFVLYSYNGIDYMGHQDRLRAFSEIRRVLRAGGFFCLSSHNLHAVPLGGWPRFTWNPLVFLQALKHRMLLGVLNDRGLFQRLQHERHAVIRDMPRTLTYYVAPTEQVRQLTEAGFRSVQIFSLSSGDQLADASEAERTPDPWLYYLCEAA